MDKKDLISDSNFNRLLRTISFGSSQTADMAAASDLSANPRIAQENTETVLTSVDGGVMRGRNGALVLGPVFGTLRVRLVAPLEKCAERVMYKTGLSASEATEQCHLEDRLRQEMSWALYRWNPNRDEEYDLVLNTASMTYQQIVDVIEEVYRGRCPEKSAELPPAGISSTDSWRDPGPVV